MSGATYYERNRDVILNRAKYYYENNKEILREKAKNKHRKLSEKEKKKKKKYGRNRYHDMFGKKQRLKKYQINYREAKNIFHRCRYDDKDSFQNCYRKVIFY